MMNFHAYALFLSSLIVLFSSSIQFASSLPEMDPNDLQLLNKFRAAVEDPNGNLTSWSDVSKACNWTGIMCSSEGRIKSISLSELNLQGPLLPEFASLSMLEIMDLYGNSFIGSIPAEFGKLSNLVHLDLHMNNLSGSIPREIGLLTKLDYLDLSWNSLSGIIPEELGGVPVQVLTLSQNNLTGNIPSLLCRENSTLISLDLSGNNLEGAIPSEISHCTNLDFLDLTSNGLSGVIPQELGKLKALGFLNLGDNELTGDIPDIFGELINLFGINLWGNKLSGSIPPISCNEEASFLAYIWLYDNLLTGNFPESLQTCAGSLLEIRVQNNRLSGSVPEWMSKFKQLNVLDISKNSFTLNISFDSEDSDSSWTANSSALPLNGTLPQFSELTNLKFLNFQGNQLFTQNQPREAAMLSWDIFANNNYSGLRQENGH